MHPMLDFLKELGCTKMPRILSSADRSLFCRACGEEKHVINFNVSVAIMDDQWESFVICENCLKAINLKGDR